MYPAKVTSTELPLLYCSVLASSESVGGVVVRAFFGTVSGPVYRHTQAIARALPSGADKLLP